jgi:3alpha(or 20beta)-hydroxysteroid dehydrogenase
VKVGKLDGRVAIITGGARGQGAAEARLLVDHGARVLIADVLVEEGERLAAELGPRARFERLDVSSPEDWEHAVRVARSMGPIRVLVNNAAIHWLRPLVDETLDDFQRMLAVNLAGPFLGIKAVVEPMAAAGGGSIINVSSIAGLTGFSLHGAYGSAKWGLRGLTKTAALELAAQKIRVNSVHPGAVNTAMVGSTDDPHRFDRVPLRRCAEPDEVAQLILFLASDDSSYMTGSELTIDGGASAGVHAAPPTLASD